MILRWYLAVMLLPVADGAFSLVLAGFYGTDIEFAVPVLATRMFFFFSWLMIATLIFSPLLDWFQGKGDAASARRRLQILGPLTTTWFVIDYAVYQFLLLWVLPQFEIHDFSLDRPDVAMAVTGRLIFLGYLVHVLADSWVTHAKSKVFREFVLDTTDGGVRGRLRNRILAVLVLTAFLPLGFMIINILTAPEEEILRRGVAIGTSAMLAVLVTAVIGGSRIHYPLKRLMEGLWAVRSGRIDVRVPVTTNDEIGLLTSAFNEMLLRIRRQEFLRGRLGRFLSEDNFQTLLREQNPLQPTTRDGSLVLVDIDGFRNKTADLDLRDRADLLRRWRQAVIAIARQYDGVPVSFAADRILISFGLPVQSDDWREQSLLAALRLQALSMPLLEESDDQEGQEQAAARIAARIRVHSGRMTGGVVGARDSLSYEILGSIADMVRRLDWHPAGRKESLLITEAALPERLPDITLKRLGILPLGYSGAQQPVYAVGDRLD